MKPAPGTVETTSWSRFPRTRSRVIELQTTDQPIPFAETKTSFLPYGMGRSLGDSCLNDGNTILKTAALNRQISFDAASGVLRAEAGITFDAILRLAIPHGWFLPVTPGTRFVTLGGAIGNDVHGKNHHREGTFGRHVLRLALRRSDGSTRICSPTENAEWLRATIGGLGLTGLITWAEIQLKPIRNSWLDAENIRYGSLSDFYALSDESVNSHEYVVAWVNTLSARGRAPGVFFRGNHNRNASDAELVAPSGPQVTVPGVLPVSILNRVTLGVFNAAYSGLRPRVARARTALGPFFYPLDGIGEYHRLYGPGGMIQWQALVPSRDAAGALLAESRKVGPSFLSVMKVMGDLPAAGLLSFSGRGVTIALDFPYDRQVIETLPRLDELVAEAGGRLYPAKDARMAGRHFRRFYPQWEELVPYIDPKFSSSFWRRVTAPDQER